MKPQSTSTVYRLPSGESAIRASMTAISEYANLFTDRKELYRFLVACQKAAIEKNSSQLVSLSLEIPPVDPLAAIQAMAQPEDLHFYWEKTSEKEAIAAIGSVTSLKINGSDRFIQTQDFIQSCVAQSITAGAQNLFFSGLHFFCSFTFYDEPLGSEVDFPSATVFLPCLQVARQGNRGVVVLNSKITSESNLERLTDSLWHQLKVCKSLKSIVSPLFQNKSQRTIHQNERNINLFKNAVSSSLESINAKQLNKIVLAHAVDVTSPTEFNLVNSLNNLRKRSPDCYVFSLGNGKGQSFIGASPERLISIRDRALVTDALAGSAPRGKTAAEDAELANRLLMSEKEQREHRIVVDFITQRLKKLGLSPKVAPTPKLLQLSNIQHIWTPIQANVLDTIHPLKILAELHPTPAVAGAPRDIACEQIRRYEPFNRSLYAAPLGWIDRFGNSEFIVGIRSALIEGDRAKLYAGAGIVVGSDPDKELAEVQLKLQSLLNSLV